MVLIQVGQTVAIADEVRPKAGAVASRRRCQALALAETSP